MSVCNFFSICSELSTKLYHNTVDANLPPNLRHLSWPANLNWRLVRSCSHVIPSHGPQRNTHLVSLTRRILTDQTSRRSCHDCSNSTLSVKKHWLFTVNEITNVRRLVRTILLRSDLVRATWRLASHNTAWRLSTRQYMERKWCYVQSSN